MNQEELRQYLSKLKRIKTLAQMVGYASHEAMRLLIRKHNVQPIKIDTEDFYHIDHLPEEIKQRIEAGRIRKAKEKKTRKGSEAPEGSN